MNRMLFLNFKVSSFLFMKYYKKYMVAVSHCPLLCESLKLKALKYAFGNRRQILSRIECVYSSFGSESCSKKRLLFVFHAKWAFLPFFCLDFWTESTGIDETRVCVCASLGVRVSDCVFTMLWANELNHRIDAILRREPSTRAFRCKKTNLVKFTNALHVMSIVSTINHCAIGVNNKKKWT